MKKLVNTIFVTSTLIFAITLSGCNKKCDLGQDVTSGEIKTGVSVFPASGYITNTMTPDQYLITGSSPFTDKFQISHDLGMTRGAVNYNEYSILCYPMTVNCFAQFDKNVTIDDNNGVVKYTIRVKDCGRCEEERFIENFVAIRSVPDYYTVTYDVDIQTVN